MDPRRRAAAHTTVGDRQPRVTCQTLRGHPARSPDTIDYPDPVSVGQS